MFALAVAGMVVVAAGDLMMAYAGHPDRADNFQNPDPDARAWLPLALVGVFLLRGIGSFISDYGMAYTGHRVVFDLRRELDRQAAAAADAVLRRARRRASCSRSSRSTRTSSRRPRRATITTAIRSTLDDRRRAFGWLLWLNWRLTLLTFVVLPLVAVVIRYFSRRLRRIARDVQTRTGSLTHVLEEMIGGHRIVRVFGGEELRARRARSRPPTRCATR